MTMERHAFPGSGTRVGVLPADAVPDLMQAMKTSDWIRMTDKFNTAGTPENAVERCAGSTRRIQALLTALAICRYYLPLYQGDVPADGSAPLIGWIQGLRRFQGARFGAARSGDCQKLHHRFRAGMHGSDRSRVTRLAAIRKLRARQALFALTGICCVRRDQKRTFGGIDGGGATALLGLLPDSGHVE